MTAVFGGMDKFDFFSREKESVINRTPEFRSKTPGMSTTNVLQSCVLFEKRFLELFDSHKVNPPQKRDVIDFNLCFLASKAVHVCFSVAMLMPTEEGRRAAAQMLTEEHKLLDLSHRKQEAYLSKEKLTVPRNMAFTAKRLNLEQSVKLSSIRHFDFARLEGYALLLKKESLANCPFHPLDTALAKQLHDIGRQALVAAVRFLQMANISSDLVFHGAHFNDTNMLTKGLPSPPLIAPSTEDFRQRILQDCGLPSLDAGQMYVMLHPNDTNHCIGFAVTDVPVHLPRSKLWVELQYVSIVHDFRMCGLGSKMVGWIKRTAQRNGFASIFIKKASAEGCASFWRKMRFAAADDSWLFYGPLSKVHHKGFALQ